MDESHFLEVNKNWEHPSWYGTTQFEKKIKEIFMEKKGLLCHLTIRFLDAGEAFNDFWSMSRNFKTVITLNPESNFTRRERNHSPFHWNKLMNPELLIWIWMLNKGNASMIIGISMGQEMCLIHG